MHFIRDQMLWVNRWASELRRPGFGWLLYTFCGTSGILHGVADLDFFISKGFCEALKDMAVEPLIEYLLPTQ